MSLSKHPLYDEYLPDWILMKDLYKGERAIKDKTTDYLPATQSMLDDGMNVGSRGRNTYNSFLTRALFPDYLRDAVSVFGGLLHQKEAIIELPEAMEPLRERATPSGESLNVLLRRINEAQLVEGRCGLLLDLPEEPDPEHLFPYIAFYDAVTIPNWDSKEKINFVMLNESGYVRDGFEWKWQDRHRILSDEGGVYVTGIMLNNETDLSVTVTPMLKGRTLDFIPFTFSNAQDLAPDPCQPPLVGLAQLSLAIYRGEADYRQNLFMQGQDTLVVIGRSNKEDGDKPLRTGAGAMIQLDEGGDAHYIGVNSAGLSEQRSALENDRRRADNLAGQLIDIASRGESGVALQTRIGAQTATLNQVALAGGAALERMLRYIAVWMGLNPTEVTVEPNLEFADYDISGDELMKLMQSRDLGAPISLRSIHMMLSERGVAKFDYETELAMREEDVRITQVERTAAAEALQSVVAKSEDADDEEEEDED